MRKSLFLLGFSFWILDINLTYGQSDIEVGSRIRFKVAGVGTPGNKAVFGLDAGAGKSFIFYNYFSSKNLLEIDGQSGNLGIGVSSPSSKLSIYGTLAEGWNSGLELNREGGGHARVLVNDNGLYFRTFSGNNFYFRDSEDNTLVTINSDGNLGIGTTSPQSKLTVYDANVNLEAHHANSLIVYGPTPPGQNDRRMVGLTLSLDGNSRMHIQGQKSAGLYAQSTSNWANRVDLLFYTRDYNHPPYYEERMRITGDGRVGIGTASPGSKLSVNGKIHAKEVKVDLDGWTAPDYVFEKGYSLRSLSEIESFILNHKHLPEVPSGKEMEENGVNLKEMNLILLQKVEELTLHMIRMEKEIEKLKAGKRKNKGKNIDHD